MCADLNTTPACPKHQILVAAAAGVIGTCRKEGVCVALRPRNTSEVRQLAWDGKFWRKELDSDCLRITQKTHLFPTLRFLKKFILNWRIIALPCCVAFCHTTMSISQKYTYIPSLPPPSHPASIPPL